MLQDSVKMQQVALDREEFIYSGRIDKRNKKQPEFIFPAFRHCPDLFGGVDELGEGGERHVGVSAGYHGDPSGA